MHYEISDLPTIPADRSSWGASAAIAEDTNARIVKMFGALDADKKSRVEARKVAAFYSTFVDETAIEAKAVAQQQFPCRNTPLQNAIVFAAAILQPPFYDPKAADATNYGA